MGIGTSGQNVVVGAQMGAGVAARATGTKGARLGAATAKVAIPNTKADAMRRLFFMGDSPGAEAH